MLHGGPADWRRRRSADTRQIYRDIDYVPGSTTNGTSITDVLESREAASARTSRIS